MTVTFSAQDAGTSEARWLHSPLTRLRDLDVPGAGQMLIVIAAHPDDESLGAGGLIATAARNGATVRLLVCTDGEASHPSSRTHTRAQLAARRRDEMSSAAGQLCPTLVPIHLGLEDGTLHRDIGRLHDLIAPHIAAASVVATTWSGDGHPDHEACGQAVTQLLADRPEIAHWQYPVWAWHWAAPDQLPWSRMGRVTLDGQACRAKQSAIAAHRSQHEPLSAARGDEAILPEAVLAHFRRDHEAFVVGAAPAASADYFDDLYHRTADPWGLADRFYERRKRELLLASLPRERFLRAFEPGCATGLLTERLADRCAEVIAWDGASAAVDQARERARAHATVHVEHARIPDRWPPGKFDLIVLSEVAYYSYDLDALVARIRDSLATDGVVVACHWQRPAPDHPHTGAAAHAALSKGLCGMHRLVRHNEADFLLDVWTADPRSVAQAEGIVE